MTTCPSPMALLFCLGLCSGCGPSTAAISGSVTFQGAPVPSGTVSVLAGDRIYQTEIQNGLYRINGVPPGEAKIAVARLDPTQPDPYEALNEARRQMIAKKAAHPRDVNPAVVTDAVQLERLQRKRHLLPFVYSSPNTSNLRLTVTAGKNNFDIDLRDVPQSQ